MRRKEFLIGLSKHRCGQKLECWFNDLRMGNFGVHSDYVTAFKLVANRMLLEALVNFSKSVLSVLHCTSRLGILIKKYSQDNASDFEGTQEIIDIINFSSSS